MYMMLVFRPVEHSSDEIAFLRNGFFADGTNSLESFFYIRVTTWATKDMTQAILVAGEHGRLDLRSAGQNSTAQGTDACFASFTGVSQKGLLSGFFRHSPKKTKSKNKQRKADENQ
jgi:hypothetical protein